MKRKLKWTNCCNCAENKSTIFTVKFKLQLSKSFIIRIMLKTHKLVLFKIVLDCVEKDKAFILFNLGFTNLKKQNKE